MTANPTPIVYTPDEVAALLRVPTSTVRTLMRRNDLGSIKVGRRVLVPARAIDTYIESLMDKAVEA